MPEVDEVAENFLDGLEALRDAYRVTVDAVECFEWSNLHNEQASEQDISIAYRMLNKLNVLMGKIDQALSEWHEPQD